LLFKVSVQVFRRGSPTLFVSRPSTLPLKVIAGLETFFYHADIGIRYDSAALSLIASFPELFASFNVGRSLTLPILLVIAAPLSSLLFRHWFVLSIRSRVCAGSLRLTFPFFSSARRFFLPADFLVPFPFEIALMLGHPIFQAFAFDYLRRDQFGSGSSSIVDTPPFLISPFRFPTCPTLPSIYSTPLFRFRKPLSEKRTVITSSLSHLTLFPRRASTRVL